MQFDQKFHENERVYQEGNVHKVKIIKYFGCENETLYEDGDGKRFWYDKKYEDLLNHCGMLDKLTKITERVADHFYLVEYYNSRRNIVSEVTLTKSKFKAFKWNWAYYLFGK